MSLRVEWVGLWESPDISPCVRVRVRVYSVGDFLLQNNLDFPYKAVMIGEQES